MPSSVNQRIMGAGAMSPGAAIVANALGRYMGQPPAAVNPPPIVPPPAVPPPSSPLNAPAALPAMTYAPMVLPGGANNPLFNPMTAVGGRTSIPPFMSSAAGTAADPIGTIANAGCSAISNPAARAACMAAAGLAAPWLSSRLGTSSSASAGCPQGYKPDGRGGCQLEGIGPYLPGDVGRQDFGWQATNGRYGAGYVPIAVQSTRRACPDGSVLGKDGICYDSLPRSQRAHNPGTKPLLTGGDVSALNRARRLQKSIGKLNTRFGPKKKSACGCSPRKKK